MTRGSVREGYYEAERRKWDEIARRRGHAGLRVVDRDFGAYCTRVSTMEGIAPFLGDLRGADVLELGCGMGELTTLLALSGARVTALDISSVSVGVASRRARLHGVEDRCTFVVGAAETLPFADTSFDVVVGKAVLHHLDPRVAATELERVMRPGARAAFAEPLGTNPALAWARDHLPYPGKNPVGDDEPLTEEALTAWQAPFEQARRRELQLLAMAARAVGRRPPRWLRRLDAALLERFPRLRRHCRWVVLTMRKGEAVGSRFQRRSVASGRL